jgi:isocitrate/isopropylmalate dehydrogenase
MKRHRPLRQISKQQANMNILILEGDGIGPEIAAATVKVLTRADEAFGLGLKFSSMPIGFAAMEKFKTTFPSATLEAAKQADGTVLGPVSHNDYPPVAQGGINPSGALRIGLDLYANIRPARTRTGFAPPCGRPLDFVIVRENTEGFYSDRSMFVGPGELMPTPRPCFVDAQDHAARLDTSRSNGAQGIRP